MNLSLTIFGESHGWAVGAVLDGMAAGVPVDEAFVAACMDKRRARGDGLSTPRTEADAVQFLSGVVNGCTTGTAIALMVENQNTRSADYAKTADLLRPGHADYTAYAKYHALILRCTLKDRDWRLVFFEPPKKEELREKEPEILVCMIGYSFLRKSIDSTCPYKIDMAVIYIIYRQSRGRT